MSPLDRRTGSPVYDLGYSDVELARLAAQARMLPITRRFLLEAGISPGMRILDVGSGAGDVAFLTSKLVGRQGKVVGTDTSAVALATAQARREVCSLDNVSFRQGDPTDMQFDHPFDAVVGRYVLMWQPDPVAMLRKLAMHLRPGGIMFFHELDWGGARSFPPCVAYDRCCKWVIETLRHSGIEMSMGTKLHSVFVAAGLPAPSMRLEAIIGGSRDSTGRISDFIDTVLPKSFVPLMVRYSIATADEVGLETLGDRIFGEIEAISLRRVRNAHRCWTEPRARCAPYAFAATRKECGTYSATDPKTAASCARERTPSLW